MDILYNNHYIRVDAKNRIIDYWSDGPHPDRDTAGTILYNDQGGYQFRFIVNGVPTEENPPFRDIMGVPLYTWDGTVAVNRSIEEIEADRPTPEPPVPNTKQQLDVLAAAIMEMAGELYG